MEHRLGSAQENIKFKVPQTLFLAEIRFSGNSRLISLMPDDQVERRGGTPTEGTFIPIIDSLRSPKLMYECLR